MELYYNNNIYTVNSATLMLCHKYYTSGYVLDVEWKKMTSQ